MFNVEVVTRGAAIDADAADAASACGAGGGPAAKVTHHLISPLARSQKNFPLKERKQPSRADR